MPSLTAPRPAKEIRASRGNACTIAALAKNSSATVAQSEPARIAPTQCQSRTKRSSSLTPAAGSGSRLIVISTSVVV